MKKLIVLNIVLAFCFHSVALTNNEIPKVFTWDGRLLLEARKKALSKDENIMKPATVIIKKADKMLTERDVAVTDKSAEALKYSGGDLHNYVSSSIYFWPDTTDANKPWIRVDGKFNIDFQNKFDYITCSKMTERVKNMTLTWWLTNDLKYARKAVEQIRVWFLNKETCMNPNMERAQFVPNDLSSRSVGSCYGILDAERFTTVLNCVGILRLSGAWTEKDNIALQAWFREFTKWLMESKNGKQEGSQLNNHGVFYDVTLCTGLLFANDTATARKVLNEVPVKRIQVQIEPDGSMPRELARAGSFHYLVVNLEAFTKLATVAEKANLDLWNYKTADNRSIKSAINYAVPYLNGTKLWEYKEKFVPKDLFDVFWIASFKYPELTDVLNKQIIPQLPAGYIDYNQINITYPLNHK